jgi:hypothetical protein
LPTTILVLSTALAFEPAPPATVALITSTSGEKPKYLENDLFAEFTILINDKTDFGLNTSIQLANQILINNGVHFISTTASPPDAKQIIKQYLIKKGKIEPKKG